MRPTQEAQNPQNPEERRRFERVDIAHQSQVLVMDAKGGQAGVLRREKDGLRILGSGDLKAKLTITANHVSGTAKAARYRARRRCRWRCPSVHLPS